MSFFQNNFLVKQKEVGLLYFMLLLSILYQTKKMIKLVSDTEGATAQLPSAETWKGTSVKNLDQS